MAKYIDVLLTKCGVFCAAPPWEGNEGNLVCLPDALTGENKILEVIAVATCAEDSEYVQMLEKYIGYPLPKITAKYSKREMKWEENNVQK